MLIVAIVVVVVAVRFRGSSLENNQLQKKPTLLLLATFLEFLEKVQRASFFFLSINLISKTFANTYIA